ncbi:hypothetical protein HGG79_04455 [Clostridium tetanomorphum]|uniref:Uncharacterized protein n=1 Tax=Clostridium tetanomorphum TaxID=1553 RepID=A0A923E9R6_CLOTT|nr:hypothetical protein [Clostridium tetanomorphum]
MKYFPIDFILNYGYNIYEVGDILDKEILDILKLIQSDMKSMQSDMKSIQGDIKKLDSKVENVENNTDKNTLLLEELNKKVKVVGEVQTSFAEQLNREKGKEEKSLDDRLEVIELAIKDTSSRVKEVQKELARVVRNTAENWAEIVELKIIK